MKRILIGVLAALGVYALTGFAIAAPQNNQNQNEYTERVRANCANVEGKIESRLSAFETIQNAHMNVYRNMKERLTKFASRIKSKGYDTTKLEADLAKLDGMITEFSEAHNRYMNALREMKGYPCSKPEDFKDKLAEVKNQLKFAHQEAAEIRAFIGTTIKEDLKALKQQNPGAVSNSTKTASPSSGE
ncbi:MAG: hypothetical protein OEV37_00890 [Candidatus Berkelbacteria bacterium]|nr:hypothetical protein [Candidatus Berkelbacteria bacterium]